MKQATTVEYPLPPLPPNLDWEVQFVRDRVGPSGHMVIVRLRKYVGDRQFKMLASETDTVWFGTPPESVAALVATLAKKVWEDFTAPERESAQLYAFAEAVRTYTGAEVIGA